MNAPFNRLGRSSASRLVGARTGKLKKQPIEGVPVGRAVRRQAPPSVGPVQAAGCAVASVEKRAQFDELRRALFGQLAGQATVALGQEDRVREARLELGAHHGLLQLLEAPRGPRAAIDGAVDGAVCQRTPVAVSEQDDDADQIDAVVQPACNCNRVHFKHFRLPLREPSFTFFARDGLLRKVAVLKQWLGRVCGTGRSFVGCRRWDGGRHFQQGSRGAGDVAGTTVALHELPAHSCGMAMR